MSQADCDAKPICRVSVEELAAAAQLGQPMDNSSCKLLCQELETLKCRRERKPLNLDPPERHKLAGIALSGGGIRSAIFCLGVLQELAKKGLLKRFDYLSTVSGGGYIGSSLTWCLSGRWDDQGQDHAPEQSTPQRWKFGLDKTNFPYGVGSSDDPADEVVHARPADQPPEDAAPLLLNYLRKHGHYLTPGGGITVMSGISVAVRAMFLNLFVSIPLITAGFLLVYWLPRGLFPNSSLKIRYSYSGLLEFNELICTTATSRLECLGRIIVHDLRFTWDLLMTQCHRLATSALTLVFLDAACLALGIAVLALVYYVVTECHQKKVTKLRGKNEHQSDHGVAAWWLRALIVVLVAYAVFILLHAAPDRPADFQRDWLLILATILAGTYGILCLAYSFLGYFANKCSVRSDSRGARHARKFSYLVRRLFESWAGVYLTVFAGLLVIGSVPLIADWMRAPAEDGTTPTAHAGLGIGSGFVALLAGLVATIAAFLRSSVRVEKFLRDRGFQVAGGFTAILAAALLLFAVLVISYHASSAIRIGAIPPIAAVVILVAAILSSFWVNTNHTSLGRFYRDRLLEAFMPAWNAKRPQAAPHAADRMLLSEAPTDAPYHIINTNVVLVRAKDPRRRLRGGDSFILTRDYCGSNATGWCKTNHFMAGRMTVSTAMAISGAAANPNTGVGGVGLTRSKAVSVLMALVNLRLGYWVPHPINGNQNANPNHFRPGLTSFFVGLREESCFQELTDGGHFENLGIYELIRRRLRLILVCDAGADPGFQFGDLQMALHRIKEDFGARIEFCDNCGIEGLIPEKTESATYPKGLEQAKRGFAVASICYPSDLDPEGKPLANAQPAWLVYLKSTIVPDLPLALRGYKARNPEFPNHSTGDQFFDEDQFEAYRQLGQQLARSMIKELRFEKYFP